MLTAVNCLLASIVTHPVPDSGMTAVLVTGSVVTLGLFARFMRSRKK